MSVAAAAQPSWTVRAGTPRDAAGVVRLFEETFGKATTAEEYAWRFHAAPRSLDAATTFLALAGDRVVAHLGGSPLRLRLAGADVPAVHICLGMVTGDVRMQGVMRAVHETANAAWAAAGAALGLALPNQNWVRLRDRLDYRAMFPLGWMWRPLRLPFPGRRGGIDISRIESPGREFDVLWDEVGPRYDGLVVRDRAWIRHRYADAPGAEYRILLALVRGAPSGYVAYRVEGRTSTIVDLFAAPEDRAARAALVRAACRDLAAEGVRAVRMFVVPGSPLALELRWRGFVPRRGAYDVCIVPFAHGLPWEVLRNPQRFFVAAGDFDVV